jgi:hypothetical protein
MDFFNYLLYDAYSHHITASERFSITNGYVRKSQHLQNPLGCSVLIQSTGIEMIQCLGAITAFITETTFPKLLGRCENTTIYHNL